MTVRSVEVIVAVIAFVYIEIYNTYVICRIVVCVLVRLSKRERETRDPWMILAHGYLLGKH